MSIPWGNNHPETMTYVRMVKAKRDTSVPLKMYTLGVNFDSKPF